MYTAPSESLAIDCYKFVARGAAAMASLGRPAGPLLLSALLLAPQQHSSADASLSRPLLINVSSFDPALAVHAIAGDSGVLADPALHVALAPPLNFSSPPVPVPTTLVHVANATGDSPSVSHSLSFPSTGLATLFPITWPPMSAGCSSIPSTSMECRFVAVLGSYEGVLKNGGSVTVINATASDSYQQVCAVQLDSAVSKPFLSHDGRALYFWTVDFSVSPSHRNNPNLVAVDLRTCEVVPVANPWASLPEEQRGSWMLVNSLGDNFNRRVATSGGGNSGRMASIVAGYISYTNWTTSESGFGILGYDREQQEPWSAPPPELDFRVARTFASGRQPLGNSRCNVKAPPAALMLPEMDTVCTGWPARPGCTSSLVQRVAMIGNGISGQVTSIDVAFDVPSLNVTSVLNAGNWLTGRTPVAGVVVSPQGFSVGALGLAVLAVTPRGSGLPSCSIALLMHGNSGELYLNDGVALPNDPTGQQWNNGLILPAAQVVASTTRYASHTDQANHIFAVYNDFKAADKQIMRLDADYNFQFKPVSGLTK